MKVKSARGSGPGSMLAGPYLVSSALLQPSHEGHLEGARAGILTHRKKGGRGQSAGGMRPERKGWIPERPSGENLQG